MILPRTGIVHATVVTHDVAAACDAYTTQLGLGLAGRALLEAADAARLGLPDLAGAPLAWLANSQGVPILRLVEDRHALAIEPMFRHGWLSLEVLVGDVDGLTAGLQPPFKVLGAPANLELSDSIRAAQVLGPCGELLYLTQVKAEVPPFDLPMTRAAVDVPFIGVTITPDREASRRAWCTLLGAEGWSFETRITVLNRAHGKPLDGRYPVAVVPMPGKCLVEIDQVDLPASGSQRTAGLHSLSLRLPAVGIDALLDAGWKRVHPGPRLGLVGPAGEHVELEFTGA